MAEQEAADEDLPGVLLAEASCSLKMCWAGLTTCMSERLTRLFKPV